MLLKLREQDVIVKVSDIHTLLDPYAQYVEGRTQWGVEKQTIEPLRKMDLCFLSGESLPQCWLTSGYPDSDINRHRCGTVTGMDGFTYYGT